MEEEERLVRAYEDGVSEDGDENAMAAAAAAMNGGFPFYFIWRLIQSFAFTKYHYTTPSISISIIVISFPIPYSTSLNSPNAT